MKFRYLFFVFALLQLLHSCSTDDFDLDGFESIAASDVFATIQPNRDYDFFEFRLSFCGETTDFSVNHTFGEACKDAEDTAECLDELNNLMPENVGFDIGCLPSCCSRYVVAQENDTNILFDTIEELKMFLGPIDSVSDALILAEASGYYYIYDELNESAIKETSNGFEVMALVLTSDCAPIIIEQHVLRINQRGDVTILSKRENSRNENACI
jgi:hypothetical protein